MSWVEEDEVSLNLTKHVLFKPETCPDDLWQHAKSILSEYKEFCYEYDKITDEERYKDFVLPLGKYSRENQIRIVLIDTDGVVLFDSSRSNNTYNNYQHRPRKVSYVIGAIGYNHSSRVSVMNAQKHGVGLEKKWSNTVHQHQVYLAVRLGDESNNVGTIRLSRDMTPEEKIECKLYTTKGLE